jgi:hypothetical protein
MLGTKILPPPIDVLMKREKKRENWDLYGNYKDKSSLPYERLKV